MDILSTYSATLARARDTGKDLVSNQEGIASILRQDLDFKSFGGDELTGLLNFLVHLHERPKNPVQMDHIGAIISNPEQLLILEVNKGRSFQDAVRYIRRSSRLLLATLRLFHRTVICWRQHHQMEHSKWEQLQVKRSTPLIISGPAWELNAHLQPG